MDTLQNVTEEITTESSSLSLVIPVRVCIQSSNFETEFSCSIDEAGQIVLTPNDVETQFLSAKVLSSEDADAVEELDADCDYISKTIYLHTTVLTEKPELNILSTVDEVGQCIVYPDDDTSTFLTVGLGDSLNLVTEEFDGVTEYFGYKIFDKDGKFEVRDYTGDVIAICDTCAQGKLVSIINEYNVLSDIVKQENVEETPDLVAIVCCKTNNFEDTCGTLVCDTAEELETCEKTLAEHYSCLAVESFDNKHYVTYSNDSDALSKEEIILKILQGNMDLVELDIQPDKNVIELVELNTDKYKFYYDLDTGVSGYYVVKEDE